jgi:hypothetical protein
VHCWIILAEYRTQIVVGGIAAVFIAISIAAAALYLPTVNLNGLGSSTSSSFSSTISTVSAPVTIYVNNTITQNSGSISTSTFGQTASSTTQTVTVTVTDISNGTATTVYETVTVASSGTCPPYGGSGTPTYCVPVMISNSQTSSIASGTQIMLRVDWESFTSYLAPNVGNVIFTNASGGPLYAWCESSCANSQPISNIWIKDDAIIPPSGQQEIFMYIFPVSQIQYNSFGYWGAFPIITATYGQYDNGPKVFDFYNNFNGTSLCGCLTPIPVLGSSSGGSANYSVSNGLTIAATGGPGGAGYGYHVYLNTPESYSAIDSNVVATNLPNSASSGDAFRYDAMDLTPPATSYLDNGFYSSYSSLDLLCGCGNSFSIHLDDASSGNGSTITTGSFQSWIGVNSLVWSSTGSQYANYMEIQQLRGTDSTLAFAPTYADITFINGLSSQSYMTFHWMRTRNVPPNDVMPTASFGAIFSYQP